ncbi:MAG: sulfatase-like hydrolase/transferase, partial [Rhodospirillales bacterium]|nr:sulfatase-like hydrolase/transferase [Rhodospirillales bacterium]
MRETNMLVIMADQHNPKMLGCNGHELVKTPNLDRLANQGVNFKSAYTNSPICVPARACFATGRYVHDTGCWDNAFAYEGKQPSWGHRLQDNGNSVVSIGKLHYRSEEYDTGFDEQIIPMHITNGVGDVHGAIRPELAVRYQARQYVEQVGPGDTNYAEYDRDITRRACDWLLEKGKTTTEKPWVLFVSLVHPHFPLIAPQEFYDMYPLADLPEFKPADEELFANHPWWKAFNNCFIYEQFFRDDEHRKITLASYLGLCSFMDNNVGQVLAALTASGMEDETRIIYTSDHGDNMGARRIWGKSTWHEESAGIPMLMTGPDVPINETIDTPVSLVDIFPTILEGAGAPLGKGDETLPGRSLLEIAVGENNVERTVFGEYHAAGATSAAYMLRTNRYKYVHYADGFDPELVHYAGGFDPELYDLENDPEELRNIAHDPGYSELISSFRSQLESILDPEATNERALNDQRLLVKKYGGRDAIIARGSGNNTPL